LFRQISRRGTAALGIFAFVVGEKCQSPMVPALADAHADKDKALEEEVARRRLHDKSFRRHKHNG
jgi:hypothetical protein